MQNSDEHFNLIIFQKSQIDTFFSKMTHFYVHFCVQYNYNRFYSFWLVDFARCIFHKLLVKDWSSYVRSLGPILQPKIFVHFSADFESRGEVL